MHNNTHSNTNPVAEQRTIAQQTRARRRSAISAISVVGVIGVIGVFVNGVIGCRGIDSYAPSACTVTHARPLLFVICDKQREHNHKLQKLHKHERRAQEKAAHSHSHSHSHMRLHTEGGTWAMSMTNWSVGCRWNADAAD